MLDSPAIILLVIFFYFSTEDTTVTKTYTAYARMTADDKAALDAIVEALPGNQSDHIRQAIRDYCQRMAPILAGLHPGDHAQTITLREPAQ